MATSSESSVTVSGRARAALRLLRPSRVVILGLLLVIWVLLPAVPEGTGLRFGMGYRAFFTVMVCLAALLFWLLDVETIPSPRGNLGVLGSLVGVGVVTIGGLVAAGAVYPQFPRPEAPGAAAATPAGRGKDLFWRADVGCFRCHLVDGTGGTRGPDLTQVAARAEQRVQGLGAQEYLRQKIAAGANYSYIVPEYVPMMPPFGQILPESQIEDLVSYLLSLQK